MVLRHGRRLNAGDLVVWNGFVSNRAGTISTRFANLKRARPMRLVESRLKKGFEPCRLEG